MADKKSDQKFYGVYIKSLLTTKILLSINEIGQNIRQNLEKKIAAKVEGKCGIDGFIQPKSVSVKTYSNGIVNTGTVEFQAVFECMICRPVEGMLIECIAKTITKAGIHAEVVGKHGEVPITAHIARDHNYNDPRFSEVKEKDVIRVKVIGVRFELNDPCIDVIGKVVERRSVVSKISGRSSVGYLENSGERGSEGFAKKRPLKIGGEYVDGQSAIGEAIEGFDYSGGESTDDENL